MDEIQGIPIEITHEPGSFRMGRDEKGFGWMTRMKAGRGIIRGLDGEGAPIKAWIGSDPESKKAFLVHQIKEDGTHDEQKLALGFSSQTAALNTLKIHYPSGVNPIESIHPLKNLEDWLIERECWHHTAKEHHGKPHLYKKIPAYFEGKRIPVEHVPDSEIEEELAKADYPPPQPGDKWITVHPNGEGSIGHPVLLHPVKGHRDVYHVIGGAGGKLNFLRVTLTKSPEDYKKEALERRAFRKQQEKERLAKMPKEERQQERLNKKAKAADKLQAEKDFIDKILGPEEAPTPDNFTEGPEQDPKAARAYHRQRFKLALAACREASRRIQLDAEARLEAGLDQTTPGLAIDDILAPPTDKGPGYDRAMKNRAASNGLTSEKLLEATKEWEAEHGKLPSDPQQPNSPTAENATAAAMRSHLSVKQIQANKRAATREAVNDALENANNLKAVLEARAELRDAFKQIKKSEGGRVFPSGFISTASSPSQEDRERLIDDISEQILTKHVQGFLHEVEEDFPESGTLAEAWTGNEPEGMQASRGAAAWANFHEAGLAIFGQGIIDRDTVETLGPEGAAQVMVHAIRNRFTPKDQKEILTALEGQHLAEQQDQLAKTTQEAHQLRERAAELSVNELEEPLDFAQALEMQKDKVATLRQARSLLGGALGRFESQAALIAALGASPVTKLQIPLGPVSPERGIQAAGAMGLLPGTFDMEHVAGEAVLTIPEESLNQLMRPIDSAAVAERELAQAIKRGDLDENNFLPAGFAVRSEQRYDNPLTNPPVFNRRVELRGGENNQSLEAALRTYIGARWADGHRATDINKDIRGNAILDDLPEHLHETANQMVNTLIPTHEHVISPDGEPEIATYLGEPVLDAQGNTVFQTRQRDNKAIEADIENLGKAYLQEAGEAENTLEGQTVDADHPDFREAVHRVLAEDPRLQSAHVGLGEFTGVQQAAIRNWFHIEHCGDNGKKYEDAIQALGPEPPQFDPGTGGLGLLPELGKIENPTYTDYQNNKAELNERYFPEGGPWERYIRLMGGRKEAQQAIQDEMKSAFADKFQHHYGRLTGRQLQIGTGDISNYSQHFKSISSPEEAAAMERERKAKQALMQKKGGGRFQSVKVKERLAGAQQASIFGQGGSLFGEEEKPETWEKPELLPGEKYTLGQRLESQITQALPNASAPFQNKEFRPVKIAENVSMSGTKVAQQRGVKMITKLKRGGLFYGAGSGKTAVMLASATELQKAGKIQKCIMAVPSVVQNQFGAEAINFLDPNNPFRVHAVPGESWEQRLQAYRDPDKHAVVITHQALRDDSIKLLAHNTKMTETQAAEWANQATPSQLQTALSAAFQAKGINFQALMIDEGHDALNRKGKPDSLIAKVLDAHGHNSEYYVGATGSPIKNDSSEAHDWLSKLDPKRYPPESRDEFLRRYGKDSAITRRALQGELSRYFFTERVDPGITAHHKDHPIELEKEQNDRISDITLASGKLQTGQDPVKWAKLLAPEKFENANPADEPAIAEKIRRAVGTFKEAAMDRAVNIGGAKTTHAVELAKQYVKDGKPIVIFAHRRDAVADLDRKLKDAGLRVASLTGKDNANEKARKLAAFQGEKPEADVIVLSDAGAVGANLQRGKAVIHMDQPSTYKTLEQRTARIYRLGQTEDIDSINLLANTDYDRRARERVAKKHQLADIYQAKEGWLDDSGLAQELRNVRARSNQAENS